MNFFQLQGKPEDKRMSKEKWPLVTDEDTVNCKTEPYQPQEAEAGQPQGKPGVRLEQKAGRTPRPARGPSTAR